MAPASMWSLRVALGVAIARLMDLAVVAEFLFGAVVLALVIWLANRRDSLN